MISFKEIMEWLAAIIVSIGGAGAILIALSKWFGNVFANKLLEKDKAKYQGELEGLKQKYSKELETKKNELEKSKAQFLRYSEHQFGIYNELWKSLCELKFIGEELWEQPETSKLKKFSQQLIDTRKIVEKSAILIENDHYKQLLEIFQHFENFQIGKMSLISIRNRSVHQIQNSGIDNHQINNLIHQNRDEKNEYNALIEKILESFKIQIKGK
jgi:hypothetical protein